MQRNVLTGMVVVVFNHYMVVRGRGRGRGGGGGGGGGSGGFIR